MISERVKSGINPGTRLTAAFLIGANLIPLIGVISWEWSILEVVLLYWAENVIIGVINIFRMALAKGEANPDGGTVALGIGLKLFMIPFFIVHYGFFCSGHGFFINSVLGNGGNFDMIPVIGLPKQIEQVIEMTGFAFWALVISHGFSFFWNYIGKKEYNSASLVVHMFAPYGRIMLLHIAILIGAFIVQFFESPIWMLVILVIGKIVMDLGLHFVAHSVKQETERKETV